MDTATFLQHRLTRSHNEYLLPWNCKLRACDELNEYKLCWILSNGANNECMSVGMLSSQDLEAARQHMHPGFVTHPGRNPSSLPQIRNMWVNNTNKTYFKMRPNLAL